MTSGLNTLNFHVGTSPLGSRREDQIDLATAPWDQLFFSCFLGDLRFCVGAADFSTKFGGLATLTFALDIARRVDELQKTGREKVDFLESDDWLGFQLDGRSVTVTASYTDVVGAIDYAELIRMSRDALSAHVEHLFIAYPRLRGNELLLERLARVYGSEPR